MKITRFEQAADYLYRRRQMGMKLDLETMERLDGLLKRPHTRFSCIHVAGTNGKGSTAAILESVLREAGYKTGLYTSPHLVDMRERMRIRGQKISASRMVDLVNQLLPHVEATRASFFETLTAMAFQYFAQENVEIAVVETGLGGRLDATNVITPILSIITEIGLEHTRILGNQLIKISTEKAGIFKTRVPGIIGATSPRVISHLCRLAESKQVPVVVARYESSASRIRLDRHGTRFNAKIGSRAYPGLRTGLLGKHQVSNSLLALLAVEQLRKKGYTITEEALRNGLEKVRWPGRLDLLQRNPDILVDSAHNPLGIRTLVQALNTLFPESRPVMVFGVLEDKNYRYMIKRIAPAAGRFIFTRPNSHRALDPRILGGLPSVKGKSVEIIPDIGAAWSRALALSGKENMICAAGSIYFVGEVLRLWETGVRP
jgi:dihydrofolate synthase/folylpolyglutamate synthase